MGRQKSWGSAGAVDLFALTSADRASTAASSKLRRDLDKELCQEAANMDRDRDRDRR